MTSERLPTVRLYFCFHGEFDPDEITRRLGIEPTTHFRPGDPITKDGQGRRLGYGWMVKIPGRETLEIDDLLQELRQQISVPGAKIRQLCQELDLDAVVICGVGQHEAAITTPTLFFSLGFLQWLTEVGASLDVDVIL